MAVKLISADLGVGFDDPGIEVCSRTSATVNASMPPSSSKEFASCRAAQGQLVFHNLALPSRIELSPSLA